MSTLGLDEKAKFLSDFHLTLEGKQEILRTADKLKDLNGLARLSHGVGAIVRDARKFTMSHGESKLEANMARQEFVTDEIKKWHKENPEQELSQELLLLQM